MNWEKLFAAIILQRGYDYYCEKAVELLDVNESEVHAEVIGSDEYEVTISFLNGQVAEMTCSCPYAQGGKHCKHMAAVLFEWSEQSGDNESLASDQFATPINPMESQQSSTNHFEEIEELVEKADINYVRSFLKTILKEDDRWFLRFQNVLKMENDEVELTYYLLIIEEIVAQFSGYDDFIDYNDASEVASELEDFLADDVTDLLNRGYYQEAFEVASQIFVLIGNVDIDDSDGEVGMLAEDIYQFWQRLLREANLEAKQMMFTWFVSNLDGTIVDYLEEYIERILFEAFDEPVFIQEKLIFAREKLAYINQKKNDWSREYHVGKWASYYLALLSKSDDQESQQELARIYHTYWPNTDVRKFAINQCIEEKDYQRALEILDESMQLDQEKRNTLAEYSRQKKAIYQLQGNQPAYLDQLWELVLKYTPGDLDVYHELKEQYSTAEWATERERVFQQLPVSASAQVAKMYQEEGLKDRLLANVIKYPVFDAVSCYEDELKAEYSSQLLAKYRKELEQAAVYTSNRKQYAEYVAILRRMKKLAGGSKVVDSIIETWRKDYKNRRAMMDELRKI